MAVPEEIEKQATPNYEVNYNDPRFSKVESEENQALTELEKTYGGMVADSDKYFDEQIEATKDWADKQTQLQQEQTDFAIEKIEQQKDQTQKDYQKEQSGAYVDWQKQSNAYGTEAEKKASNGLTNTGYSESSQVSMYNTYQNRVALARESLNKAMLDYDNAIKEATLQNNATIAEIAFQSLQQRLELSLQGFQYKNQLILEQSDKKFQIKQHYDTQWQNVLDNIYRENTLAEDVRQFDKTFAENVREFEENLALNKASLEEEKRQFNQSFSFEEKQALYESGWTKLGSLVMPSKAERIAMNMTESECKQVIAEARDSQSVSSGGGSGNAENVTNEAPINKEDTKISNPIKGSDSLTDDSAAFPAYDKVVDFMIQNGVPRAKAEKMMTKSEWGRSRKAEGTTKDQAKGTYEDYVANYLENLGL